MKTFREALRTKDFAVTAECFLKPESDEKSIREQVDLLRDHVDGVVLTDNLYGMTHMNTAIAAKFVLDGGVDPIVQMSCRNRNRAALIGDLLGASALGVSSVLLIRGKRAPAMVASQPKAVMELTVAELIELAVRVKDDENLKPENRMFIGCTMTPHAPKPDWVPEKLNRKLSAGAQFIIAYPDLDIEVWAKLMKHLIAARVTRQASVVASTLILTSADDARWLQENRSSVSIPDSVISRLEKADDPRDEGQRICAEHITQLAQVPGVSGVNIIASTDLSLIPAVIEEASTEKG